MPHMMDDNNTTTSPDTANYERGIVLFRAGQNLKHLHHARITIKGKAYTGLLNGGTGEVCGGEKLSDGSIDVDSD